jgi:hypothetical protein
VISLQTRGSPKKTLQSNLQMQITMPSTTRLLAFAASVVSMADARPKHQQLHPGELSLRDGQAKPVSKILSGAFSAVGGAQALNQVQNFTYSAPQIYRSQTLTQSYNLAHSDQTLSTTGSQNMSFSYMKGQLHTRVQRSYDYDAYWYWAFPTLQPTMN